MLFLPLLCVDDAGKWNFLTCQVSQMEEGLEEKRLHVKELQKQSKVPSLLFSMHHIWNLFTILYCLSLR